MKNTTRTPALHPLTLRRIAAFLCAVTLSLSLWIPAFASPALGDDLMGTDTVIHQQTRLSTNVFWSTVYSDFRTENFITYKPNDKVRPIITYGDTLTDVSTMTRAVRYLEQSGYRVVGGINGDFYNMKNGLPMGLIVTDGLLRSSDAGYYAIGFRKDGSAMLGKPKLSLTAGFGYTMDDGYGNQIEIRRPLAAVNKARVSTGGIYLYTYDFNGRHTTGNTEPGMDAICTIIDGKLAIGSSVKLRVESVIHATGVTSIQPNQMILSVNLRSDEWYLKALRNLPVGSEITVGVSADSPAWNDVVHGLGALYCLAENGRIVSDLANGSGPRTAVGQKADGTLIFYTIDGRLDGHSIGASLRQTAARLLELGCTTVLGLDGGGSTTISVTMPDSRTATTINSPSEGTERAVSNKIFLVADGQATGILDHFYLRPDHAYVLAGSSVNLSVSAVDTNYFPMKQDSTLTATDGDIKGTVLTTPRHGARITVTAKNGSKNGSTLVHAVDTPDSIAILDSGGTARSSLLLPPGAAVQLTAAAEYLHKPLHAEPQLFSWTSTGNAGSISADGLFTAITPGTGTITVSAGGRKTMIPVTVSKVALRKLDNFEAPSAGTGEGAVLARSVGGETVRYGRASGELRYQLGESGIARWRYETPISSPGIPYDMLTFWAMGNGSGHRFCLLVLDGEGNETLLPAATLDFTGWQQITVLMNGTNYALAGYAVTAPDYDESASLLSGEEEEAVPQLEEVYDENGYELLPGILHESGQDPEAAADGSLADGNNENNGNLPGAYEESGRIAEWDTASESDASSEADSGLSSETGSTHGFLPVPEEDAILSSWTEYTIGTIYLDQVVSTYDGIVDLVPPAVTASLSERDWIVTAQVNDEVDGVPPASSVSVSYNGTPVYNWSYDASKGIVTFALPEPGESRQPARITVTAADQSGNIGRSSVDIAPYHHSHRFTDIDGHWASDYIDFLGNRNVAVPYPDGTYRPYVNITRVEFAVMLARAVGFDGRNYAHVELPYTDLDQIPENALPALRALYEENIMRGTEGADGKLYLLPHNGLTRAQASAMIGRSQSMGYGSAAIPFPDAGQIPSYAASHIQVMVARGILGGFSDGTFRPQENITRGQMAKILYYLA